MKLYHSGASPFVRKVTVVLHELGKIDDVTLVPVVTTALDSSKALVASNPLGKLPALERADEPTLYDSRVICAYLNDLYDGPLYPQGSGRWETLTLEATGDGIMDSAVSMVYETRLRPAEHQSSEWIEAQWSKVSRAVSVLNARWMGHLAGSVDIGHISVACALAYLDFRHDNRNWRHGNENLAAWFSEFESRPGMQATRPPST